VDLSQVFTVEENEEEPAGEDPSDEDPSDGDPADEDPADETPVDENPKEELPKTGSTVDSTVLYLLASMLIAFGSLLIIKKKKINQ
jgi:LPXTG-motif cell wall-anchored protein